MDYEIPIIVERFYYEFAHELVPESWPKGFEDNPVQGHGLWSFYQGVKLGMNLCVACLDRP